MSQTAAKSLGSLQALSRYLLLVKKLKQLRLIILEAWTEESDFEVKNNVKEVEVCLPVFFPATRADTSLLPRKTHLHKMLRAGREEQFLLTHRL